MLTILFPIDSSDQVCGYGMCFTLADYGELELTFNVDGRYATRVCRSGYVTRTEIENHCEMEANKFCYSSRGHGEIHYREGSFQFDKLWHGILVGGLEENNTDMIDDDRTLLSTSSERYFNSHPLRDLRRYLGLYD